MMSTRLSSAVGLALLAAACSVTACQGSVNTAAAAICPRLRAAAAGLRRRAPAAGIRAAGIPAAGGLRSAPAGYSRSGPATRVRAAGLRRSRSRRAPPRSRARSTSRRCQSLASRNPKACGLLEVAPGVLTRVDCQAYSPSQRAIAHLSPRKALAITHRTTQWKPLQFFGVRFQQARGAGLQQGHLPAPRQRNAARRRRRVRRARHRRRRACPAPSIIARRTSKDRSRIRGRSARAPRSRSRRPSTTPRSAPARCRQARERKQRRPIMSGPATASRRWAPPPTRRSIARSRRCRSGARTSPKSARSPRRTTTAELPSARRSSPERSARTRSSSGRSSRADASAGLPRRRLRQARYVARADRPAHADARERRRPLGRAPHRRLRVVEGRRETASSPTGTRRTAVTPSRWRATARPRTATQFLVHNNWGTSWGDGGYGWVSEAMVQKWMNFAYKVRIDGRREARRPHRRRLRCRRDGRRREGRVRADLSRQLAPEQRLRRRPGCSRRARRTRGAWNSGLPAPSPASTSQNLPQIPGLPNFGR